ncbi:MAG: ABC transporter substrate-binding protein [Burkholderiaceae bacterium]|nr:ABC transporter substrate-binding protein [Burkholderiaceae bacterium]
MIRALFALTLSLCCPLCLAFSVVFINPGRSDEAYWVAAGQAMQAAADSLQISFEQRFAERDPLRVQQIAREIVARPAPQRPDYVVATNDKRTLVQVAQLLDTAGIKSFAAFSGLQDDERSQIGPPRGQIPRLLGSLEPNAEEAGYLTARALIAQGLQDKLQGTDGRLHLLAIGGDKSTPVSVRRNEGMQRAVAEQSGRVRLEQIVFADWRRDKAAEQTEWLLARHPQARLLWAGSDQMALGAMEAAQQFGRVPGKDMLFSAINTSPEAMQARIGGRLSSLAGGHFMAGAWALVMLYDHHHGRDFADEGLELDRPMFTVFDRASAERYLQRFGDGIRSIDFRPFSKVLNPRLKRYDFRFGQVMR